MQGRGSFVIWGALAIACAVTLGCGSNTASNDAADATASLSDASGASASGRPRRHVAETPPRVEVQTTMGAIVIELDPVHAPQTVANFLDYIQRGHYDGTLFHQVVEGHIVLGGGYTEKLVEKPSRTPIRNEADNGLSNRRGTVAMARQLDAIDSSTCQFFINLADNDMLDYHDRTPEGYGYCVFGRVVSGMDVVDAIGQAQVHDTPEFEMLPTQPIVIRSVRLNMDAAVADSRSSGTSRRQKNDPTQR